MLPDQMLSTTVVQGSYLVPDSFNILPLLDYEYGGIHLNDSSQGLRYQIWTLRYSSGDIILSAPNTSDTVLFSRALVSEISLAFDQNMRPFVAFVEDGVAKYWWYNTLTATQDFTDLPVGSIYPKCCLDDKRPLEVGTSDIIMAYIRANVLYFRAQRDRYTVEYTLVNGITTRLNRIGMSSVNRVQFQFDIA